MDKPSLISSTIPKQKKQANLHNHLSQWLQSIYSCLGDFDSLMRKHGINQVRYHEPRKTLSPEMGSSFVIVALRYSTRCSLGWIRKRKRGSKSEVNGWGTFFHECQTWSMGYFNGYSFDILFIISIIMHFGSLLLAVLPQKHWFTQRHLNVKVLLGGVNNK